MNTPFDSSELDVVLEALANEKRRRIIHTLSLQPSTVNQLAKYSELSLPAIYKHLLMLEKAGLIIRRKSGRTNFVVLNNETLGIAKSWIMQYQTAWGNPKASLENYIAKLQE